MTVAAVVTLAGLTVSANAEDKLWNVYEGGDGPGKGKSIVLVSGDEEYRSEEALSQLGKILATEHGFKCTVVYAVDPDTGIIDSNNGGNIPGLEALDSADLMIIATRFRHLPDDQMKHIDDFLKRGGAVIGMRTATHAFNGGGAYGHYSFNYGGPMTEWKQGFGRLVLGETWISHHGGHKSEPTLGLIAPDAKDHPMTRGIKDGDIWGPTDVYGVRLPLPGDSMPIVLGQVTKREGPGNNDDPFFGMKAETDRKPIDNKAKNDPMMPVAWTKSYQVPDGKPGKSFCTTMGSSTDCANEGVRRMIVNAVYYLLGMTDKIPADGTKVDLVGEYHPSQYGFHKGDYWKDKGLKPSDFK
ncbi:MAG: hypothetical protein GC159_20620 [Phycisphaera sp.]|nr:hypothetical protein [Phycisphaera sp.]